MKASYENVTIVVPDTTNEMIFYKYVVENHTSCTCGGINEKTPRNDKGEQGKPTTQCRICENGSEDTENKMNCYRCHMTKFIVYPLQPSNFVRRPKVK